MSHTLAANSLLVRRMPKASMDGVLPAYGCLPESCMLSQESRSMKMPRKAEGNVRSQWGLCMEAQLKNMFAILLAHLLADSKDGLSLFSETVIPPGPISNMQAGEAGLAFPLILRGASWGSFLCRWFCQTNTKVEEGCWGREPKQGKQKEIKDRK